MRSGVVYGYVGLMESLMQAISRRNRSEAKVIATAGLV